MDTLLKLFAALFKTEKRFKANSQKNSLKITYYNGVFAVNLTFKAVCLGTVCVTVIYLQQ